MRYMRNILDVICYQDRTKKEANISDEERLYSYNNRRKLQRIANGGVRFYLPLDSCSGLFMGKNLIAANEQNISEIKSSSSLTKTDDIYSTLSLLKQSVAVTNNDLNFVYARNNIVSLNTIETTLFDPNTNDNIRERHIILRNIHGRCVSYGHAIVSFKLSEPSNGWIEDLEYRNTDFLNYQCILSNENHYHASSDGVTLKSNFDIYENVPPANGQLITLVEFISIHFGGEFTSYRDCLSQCYFIKSDTDGSR
ncbi:unnamed protein product [Rotaria magnacalcarata]|uniref:Uncharacterized protein n=3 Tax=Rotaria magnacalcarata TaxID=392030 RepID=A0A816T898_9BILA|nr:unnamed protein product [Rotaria magnacalcarata]